MNIKQLQYFLAVAREGTFSAAAKALGISQPPLSNQIKLLEEELGVVLMERGNRSVRLTKAGELLYLRAGTLTDLAQSTLEEIQEQKNHLETMRLGTISSCATALLEQRLPKLIQQFPHVRFQLTEGNTFELMGALKSGVIDMAVVRTPFRREDFECAFLSREPMAAAGLSEFFTSSSTPLKLSHLADAPLIFYRRFEHILLAAFQEQGISPHVFCKNDDARTTLLWANAGLGVALAPLSICQLMGNSVVQIHPLEENGLQTQVSLIRLKGRDYTPAQDFLFSLFDLSPSI